MCSQFNIGRYFENQAAEYLKSCDYKIIGKNYRSAGGEIDLIAIDKGIICFIEVKFRRNTQKGHPLEAITYSKQKRITKTALCYVQENNFDNKPLRFDVLAILEDKAGIEFDLVKNAFDGVI